MPARARRSYTRYLKSTHWKQFGSTMYATTTYKCILCGHTRGLHKHHEYYHSLGNEKPWHVCYLCSRCHRLRHTRFIGTFIKLYARIYLFGVLLFHILKIIVYIFCFISLVWMIIASVHNYQIIRDGLKNM